MQYCSLQIWTLLPSLVTSTIGHVLPLDPSLHSVCSYFFSKILGTFWPGEFIFHCHIFSLFHTVHGVLKARILKWFSISFSSAPHSVRTLLHDLSLLGYTAILKSILKEISPEYSLEGLMLKLKLRYFGHLMWRTESLEKILMLEKIEGRRRERQRMR